MDENVKLKAGILFIQERLVEATEGNFDAIKKIQLTLQ